MKQNEKIYISILIGVLAIVLLIKWAPWKGKGTKQAEVGNRDKDQNILRKYEIDVNDEAYKDKQIYTENGDLVIENKKGGKTIETSKQENPTDLVATNETTKGNYEITDTEVKINGNRTSITGNVKNNTKSEHKIIVQSKFYGQDNKVKGSGNVKLEGIKAGETRQFEIVIMGNMTGFTNKTTVEFTN